jgi:hypothetical protein
VYQIGILDGASMKEEGWLPRVPCFLLWVLPRRCLSSKLSRMHLSKPRKDPAVIVNPDDLWREDEEPIASPDYFMWGYVALQVGVCGAIMYHATRGVPMPSKIVRREQFRLVGDEVTHLPTNKNYSAHPGRAEIVSETTADLDDYHGEEIRATAAILLAERLKKK